jgi:hypothetical protein
MRLATTAILALLMASGAGAAFGQSAQLDLRTKTTPGDALTNPASPATHDPGINPSAAGTQRAWRGWGATREGARHGSSTPPQYNRTDKRPLKPRDLRNQPHAGSGS